MNKLLTVSTALAVVLGTAGLAGAQTAAPAQPSTPGGTMRTQPVSPGTSTPGTASPSMQSPSTSGQQPQANAQSQGQPGQMDVSPATIQQAQRELKSKGLYNGAVDGIAGPETQSALSQFQRQNGLPQTAELDQQTLARLLNSTGGTNTGGTPSSTSTGPRY